MDMKQLANGGGEPPQTDLDYYSRPENYEGSNLHSLQKFIIARDKQQKSQHKSTKQKKRRKEEHDLYRRYKHILAFEESLQGESSSDEDCEASEETNSPSKRLEVTQNHGSPGRSRRMSNVSQKVALAVSEAHRPLSEGRRMSDVVISDERRSASARDDVVNALSTSPATSRGNTPTPPDMRRATPTPPDMRGATPERRSLSPAGVVVTGGAATPGRPSSRCDTPGAADSVGSSSRKTWTRALMKSSADFRSNQVRRRFQQAIKAVMSIRKLAAAMIKKSEEPSAMLKTFNDIIDMSDSFSENLKNQGLSFDPSYFKANKEISISSEVKNILRLPPSARTQEQIQTAMYGLQSLPSFAEYPLHMQEKLSKVAWYEVVPPKRTIIRQGHYAENFYFILSGQAVVTILIRDPKTGESHVRTANFMRKGTSFGELALLHHSRRTATVTSHDTVQLLSIGRDDFFDIFMARQGQDEIPEHIRFISQLDFMKGWPIERLLEHPEHCLLHFFKRNMVIVKDSEQSEWLYIVKSGSCQVLKQLRGVTARLGIPKHEVTLDESFHLPHTGTAIRGPKVDTGMRKPRPRSHRSLPDSILQLQDETDGDSKELVPNGSPNTKVSSLPPSTESRSDKNSRKFSKKSFADTAATGKAHFKASLSPERHPRLVGPRKQRPSSLTPNNSPRGDVTGPPPPVFVQVSRLKPRDVFGLEMVKFHDDLDMQQTSVSLVSRGAECIMLSKDFFRKHATEYVKKNLQEISAALS
nr:hypothetical protein BaRGS_019302 [Batillaria attramentaria]